MVAANSHGPNYLILQNFILNRKIFNNYLFFFIFGKFWWISKCVYLILKTFRNFWEFEYPHHSYGRNFGTLSTQLYMDDQPLFSTSSIRDGKFYQTFLIKITVLSICHISIPWEIFMTTLLAQGRQFNELNATGKTIII